ncbi:phosphatidate cytidylyltransferase [Paenibacillus sp. GSMTC-2017]|uniref:phosphatidate cytidylyltransferase n=1 Tax=Paenibacillus sp. GSMTC-2017 TaxID=2794350 RepID=UPI0018D77B0B|nr:phosphatidate cytidylyltransferase [Paenibacillus sp. GSMTC-2017]MBH5316606.1 phosphatidate cytidylyltransferase [Paenibacillus sp. GSMTC-2017]
MKQRLITGVIAGALFIAITVMGGAFYTGLLILLAIIGFKEYSRMNGVNPFHPSALLGYGGVLYFVLPWSSWGIELPSEMTMVWMLAFLLMAISVITKNKTTIDGAALMLLGSIYIGYGFSAMISVRAIDTHGLFWTFLAFGCIWASDIGAYFVGKAIGKTKLWPSISPNKTIEGAVGGIAVSLLVAVIFALVSPELISISKALIIGIVAAVAGQFGDLIQSAYKRVKGIKDTGSLLPGHGGVLDRCDSWIIVFPLLLLTELIHL